ncbi:putative phosphohydrolase [Bacillus sp. TS-2]|nr:putative phosphohydrolase [Bacillus sp. TS-2]
MEEVLRELIESKAIKRLMSIHQGGASYLVNEKWNVTRYDHSIGVMLLIRRLGGSLEEQIAGLLHDVSHTAFSHVIDYVLDYSKEDYHEEIFQSVIENSEIPHILARHGYNGKDILYDDSKWTLLEQPAPELCADRIDYTLRDMFAYGFITIEEVNQFLNDLGVINGKIYLQSIKTAEWFVETYYKEVIGFFMDPLNIYGYDQLAKVLRCALEKQILNYNDFLLDDEQVLNKIKASKDPELVMLLNQLNTNIKVKEDRDDYDIERKTKLRLIDPSILINNQLVPSSNLSQYIRTLNQEAFQKATQGMRVKILF